jgi:hypothetical protein
MFKELFEKVHLKGDDLKEIKFLNDFFKKYDADVYIKKDADNLDITLSGEEVTNGTLPGISKNIIDKNEKIFNNINKDIQKFKNKFEDYDFYIKNTQQAKIFIILKDS